MNKQEIVGRVLGMMRPFREPKYDFARGFLRMVEIEAGDAITRELAVEAACLLRVLRHGFEVTPTPTQLYLRSADGKERSSIYLNPGDVPALNLLRMISDHVGCYMPPPEPATKDSEKPRVSRNDLEWRYAMAGWDEVVECLTQSGVEVVE